ncbi:unnamed protein product, partial [Adineta steineri]
RIVQAKNCVSFDGGFLKDVIHLMAIIIIN